MSKVGGTSLRLQWSLDSEIVSHYRSSFLISLGISPEMVEESAYFDGGGSVREDPKRNKHILTTVAASAVYQEAVGAYREDNQSTLSRLVPLIFKISSDEAYSKGGELFHGVSVDISEQTPTEYIDTVLKIQKEGLNASPVGVHHSMDYNLRPLFSVIHLMETHGLLFYGFEPWKYGYAVFNPSFEAERLIYALTVKASLKLYLKSSKFFDKHPDGKPIRMEGTERAERSQLCTYRDELERHLMQRGVEFELVDPIERFRETGFFRIAVEALQRTWNPDGEIE